MSGQSLGMNHRKILGFVALPFLASLVFACSGAVSDDPSPGAEEEEPGSVDSDITKKKSCASVGGSCVGLAPSSCTGGTFADARKVSCGKGVGVACCVPDPDPCPSIVQPAPGFCPAGIVVPHKNKKGCVTGYDCKPDIAAPNPNACEAAGGSCVGLTPSACPDGHWGAQPKYSCGPGVGVGCCLP